MLWYWHICLRIVSLHYQLTIKTKKIMESIKVQLCKNDILALDECGVSVLEWPVNEDQELIIVGEISQYNIDEEIYNQVYNYHVQADCITVPLAGYLETEREAARSGRSVQWHMYNTFTDIGGHVLVVLRGNEKIRISSLKNGFGDGVYRLKFTQGNLYR